MSERKLICFRSFVSPFSFSFSISWKGSVLCCFRTTKVAQTQQEEALLFGKQHNSFVKLHLFTAVTGHPGAQEDARDQAKRHDLENQAVH